MDCGFSARHDDDASHDAGDHDDDDADDDDDVAQQQQQWDRKQEVDCGFSSRQHQPLTSS